MSFVEQTRSFWNSHRKHWFDSRSNGAKTWRASGSVKKIWCVSWSLSFSSNSPDNNSNNNFRHNSSRTVAHQVLRSGIWSQNAWQICSQSATLFSSSTPSTSKTSGSLNQFQLQQAVKFCANKLGHLKVFLIDVKKMHLLQFFMRVFVVIQAEI